MFLLPQREIKFHAHTKLQLRLQIVLYVSTFMSWDSRGICRTPTTGFSTLILETSEWDLTLQSMLVSICTTSYNTRRLCILPTQCIRVISYDYHKEHQTFFPLRELPGETVFPVRYEVNI
jgi:hypothetical protein